MGSGDQKMPSSLEELLAEDGFGGRRSGSGPRASLSTKTRSMPRYPSREQRKTDSPATSRFRTERTKSDLSRYKPSGELPESGGDTGRRRKDDLVRKDKAGGDLKREYREGFEGNRGRKTDNDFEDFLQNEIVEVGEIHNLERRDSYSRRVREREEYKRREGKGINLEMEHGNGSGKHQLQRAMFSDKHRRSMNLPEIYDDRSSRGSQHSKSSGDERVQKRNHLVQSVSQPALDEVAIKATVSILNVYVKRFLKNKDFRTTLYQNCFLSLNFGERRDKDADNKVISNLEEAIQVVDRAAEGSASPKELKKASVQLSVITGLSSDDLRDGFTSGVPNYKLPACAHLYLSVMFKLQKKDRISAKHLLQVFCDSPSQARVTLLPELWDYLFSPHLSHLKDWYHQKPRLL